MNLFKTMEQCGRLAPIKYDDFCNQACRRNNDIIIEKDELQPTCGGNIIVYQQMT